MYNSTTAKHLLLEVESKFHPAPSSLPIFRSNRGAPLFHRLDNHGTHKFTDTYYDHRDTLSKNGIWLRKRKRMYEVVEEGVRVERSDLEAKVRMGGDLKDSVFREITDRKAIAGLVRPYFPHYDNGIDGGSDMKDLGIGLLAEFTTIREEWRADGKFSVVIDSTGFGHAVGEVELLVGDGEEGKARMEIERFMGRYAWFFNRSGVCEGKLAAYLRLCGPGQRMRG